MQELWTTNEHLYCKRRKNSYAYVCGNRHCKRIFTIQIGQLEDIKIEIKLLLRVFYGFVIESKNYQLVLGSEISEKTLIKIKHHLIKSITAFNENEEKIGGLGVEIQLDETAICNGQIILCPSATLDQKKCPMDTWRGRKKQRSKFIYETCTQPKKQHAFKCV
jgi:hypothetical protein